MRSLDSLRGDLACFDGKHIDLLERLADELASEPRAMKPLLAIVQAAPSSQEALGAIWVIHRLHKRGEYVTVDAMQTIRLAEILPIATHWLMRLHVLQILAQTDLNQILSKPQRERLVKLVLPHADSHQAFVRAWALNVLGQIGGGVSSKSRQRIIALIQTQLASGPASVKARLRNLQSSGGLQWMARTVGPGTKSSR